MDQPSLCLYIQMDRAVRRPGGDNRVGGRSDMDENRGRAVAETGRRWRGRQGANVGVQCGPWQIYTARTALSRARGAVAQMMARRRQRNESSEPASTR